MGKKKPNMKMLMIIIGIIIIIGIVVFFILKLNQPKDEIKKQSGIISKKLKQDIPKNSNKIEELKGEVKVGDTITIGTGNKQERVIITYIIDNIPIISPKTKNSHKSGTTITINTTPAATTPAATTPAATTPAATTPAATTPAATTPAATTPVATTPATTIPWATTPTATTPAATTPAATTPAATTPAATTPAATTPAATTPAATTPAATTPAATTPAATTPVATTPATTIPWATTPAATTPAATTPAATTPAATTPAATTPAATTPAATTPAATTPAATTPAATTPAATTPAATTPAATTPAATTPTATTPGSYILNTEKGYCSGTGEIEAQYSISDSVEDNENKCYTYCKGKKRNNVPYKGFVLDQSTGECWCQTIVASDASCTSRINTPKWHNYTFKENTPAATTPAATTPTATTPGSYILNTEKGYCSGTGEIEAQYSISDSVEDNENKCSTFCKGKKRNNVPYKGFVLDQSTGECWCQTIVASDASCTSRINTPKWHNYTFKPLNAEKCPSDYPYRTQLVEHLPDNYKYCYKTQGCAKGIATFKTFTPGTNCNHKNNYINHGNNMTESECMQKCQKDNNCVAYGFKPNNNNDGFCTTYQTCIKQPGDQWGGTFKDKVSCDSTDQYTDVPSNWPPTENYNYIENYSILPPGV